MKALSDFYPRPPRGGRLFKRSGALSKKQFLSTPSARRATLTGFFYDSHHKFLSTPSARRATKPPAGKPAVIRISIHALREEGDGRYQVKRKMPDGISIHALREEGDVFPKGVIHPMSKISIHALREEGDATRPSIGRWTQNFYPRPPRGGRHSANSADIHLLRRFLSTPSARRATGAGSRVQRRFMISIHALREEGDIFSVSSSSVSSYFYPRPPRGGRPVGVMTTLAVICISIHALREEGDRHDGRSLHR